VTDEVFAVLHNVLLRLRTKHVFDIFNKDDIYQEGFIIGMTAIPLYKLSLGINLETFLYVYINSRLKNLKRNKSLRQDSRCNQCRRYNPDCVQCQARDRTQNKKKNILNPIHLDAVNPEGESNLINRIDASVEAEVAELTTLVNNKLPVADRNDYLRMKEGAYVPKDRKLLVEAKVWEIIHEYT